MLPLNYPLMDLLLPSEVVSCLDCLQHYEKPIQRGEHHHSHSAGFG